jgi:hypothetical protein
MGLSKEEKAQLDALTKKSQEPDPDDSFEVEFWQENPDGSRHGGRAPWSQGKRVFGQMFPDLFGEKPADDEGEGEAAAPAEKPGKVERFGRRVG